MNAGTPPSQVSERSAIEELKLLCQSLDRDFDRQLVRVKRTIEELGKVSSRLKEDEDNDGKH